MRVLPGIIYGIVVAIFPFSTSGGQMSSAQYSSEITTLNDNEVAARELIAQEQTQIGNLKRQISETDTLMFKTIQDQYLILKITEQDIERASSEIVVLLDTIKSLNKRSAIDLIDRKDDILQFNNQVASLKSKSVFRFPKLSLKIIEIDLLLSSVNNLLHAAECNVAASKTQLNAAQEISLKPKTSKDTADQIDPNKTVSASDTYVVKNTANSVHETLLLIAGYSQIYGDSHKWHRIYLANKDEIDRNYERSKTVGGDGNVTKPYDFIFPGQVLRIPR